MVLNALDIAVSHGNKYRKKLIMKRNTNLSLFIGNIIVYIENQKKDSTEKLLKLMVKLRILDMNKYTNTVFLYLGTNY